MEPMDILKIVAVAGALLIALYGINRIDARMKAMNQGFGPNTLRALGLVIFLPALVVLAVVTDLRSRRTRGAARHRRRLRAVAVDGGRPGRGQREAPRDGGLT